MGTRAPRRAGDGGRRPSASHALVSASPTPTDDAWLRIELSKPRRLSELRFRCPPSAHATPRRCTLDAVSGSDNGVFVEVFTFEVARPDAPPESAPQPREAVEGGAAASSGAAAADGVGDGWQQFGFYRPFKSKQYRLRIHSWHPPVLPDGGEPAGAPPRGEIASLLLMEAQLEADWTTVLHMTSNRDLNVRLAKQQQHHHHHHHQQQGRGQGQAHEPDGHAAGHVEGAKPSTIDGAADAAAGGGALGTDGGNPFLVDATRLRNQVLSERTAVARAQRTQWHHLRRDLDARLDELGMRPSLGGGGGGGGNISGGGDAAHRSHGWLARLVAELESMPAQVSDGLRDRFLADASLAGSHEVAGVPSAAAALRWAIRKHSECLSMRQRLHECLEEVSDAPTEEEVRESGECGRCRMDWGKTGAVCAHCKREARYDAYFYTLFSHRRQRKVELLQGGASRDDAGAAAGNVGEAFLEDAPLVRLLNSVIGWLCAHGASIGASSSARAHVWAELAADAARERDTLRLLKREIRACRALWAAHFDLLSQLDEVGQCVRMMELVQTPDELERLAPLEAERHLYVGVWEYDERASQYESALTLARDDLREFKGKYSFLRKQAAIADAGDARGGGAACEGEGAARARARAAAAAARRRPRRRSARCATTRLGASGRCRLRALAMHAVREQITRRHSGKFVCPLCREGSAPEQASDLR